MIIDGHAHSCGIFYQAENIIKTLDEIHADKVILCPGLVNDDKNQNLMDLAKRFRHSDLMFFINRLIRLLHHLSKSQQSLIERNEYVYHLASQYPERIMQFYWIDPNESDAFNSLIENFSHWRFKGIKTHQPSHYFSLKLPILQDIAGFAGQNRLPFFIHLYSRQDVVDFFQFAQQHPATNFIVAHLIGLEIFEIRQIKLSNVWFDISPAPLISDERILKAIKLFGAERVLLGSDTPFGKDNLKRNIERISRLRLSPLAKDLVLGKNMQRLLELTH